MTRILAIADDISGANEVAAALGSGTRVFLGVISANSTENAVHSRVLDTGTRDANPELARSIIARLAQELPSDEAVFKKVDSVLRGNTGVEIDELSSRVPVVLAPALPQMERTVENGILRVARRHIADTDLWDRENASPPDGIAALFPRSAPDLVTLDDVRSGRLRALQALRSRSSGLVICDAVTDSDLDAIVAATPAHAVLAGSRALAEALRRRDEHEPRSGARAAEAASDSPILVVVGTASASAIEQVDVLRQLGHRIVDLDPEHIAVGSSDELASDRVVVVSLTGTRIAADGAHVAITVAQAVKQLAADRDLIVTGGETARRVLDAVGARSLTYTATLEPGLVELTTEAGKRVITRPGSFGDRQSLARAVHHLSTTISASAPSD